MRAGEHGDVHGDPYCVRLVEAHAKVTLPAEQQEDEHTDVHQTNAGCRGKCRIQ